MSLPNEPKIPDNTVESGAVSIAPTVSTDNFYFDPADDWWIGPDTPEFDPSLDQEYIDMLQANAPKINMYSPEPLGNMNTPYPENSTGQYNPRLQKTPIDRTTQAGALRYLQNQISDTTQNLGPEKPFIPSPEFFSRKADKFDRFYEHPEFKNLGFSPYANNEEYYNNNSTIYDDMSRMLGQFRSITGSGFTSVYRSIGDLFDNDAYLLEGKDLETADEFQDAMDIGSSSRDGFGAFANNLFLNSGYTMGIISSIALEELALAGLTYFTGGGAAGLAGARTVFNFARLGKAAKNFGNTLANSFAISRLAKATTNMARNLNKIDAARDFYSLSRSGAKGVGKILFPETMAAVSKLKTAKTGAKNLTFMAKNAPTFGAFYRDLRSFNLAIAESKLEAGFNYNSQIANGILAEQSKPGSDGTISAEQMASIASNADKAAYSTMIRNAPLLFLSNQLVLGNAMGGFNKSLGRLMNDKITGLGKRIIQTGKTVGKGGKIAAGTVLQDAGTGLMGYLRRIKAAGVKGSARAAAGASLRYFSRNIAEGIQEVTQEAISKGTSEYYTALQFDPTIGGSDLHSYSVRSAVGSQFSGQGFETFMSGFLTGGLVQIPQMAYFQAVPYMYKNITDRKGAVAAKQARADYLNKVLEVHQESWDNIKDNPLEFFDPINFNISVQKEVSNDMKQASYLNDVMAFYDSKDFGKFHNMHTMFELGTIDLFRSQYRDFLKLSDQELATAFDSIDKKDIKSGKFRKSLEDQLAQIDKFEEAYIADKNSDPNPHDETQFKKDTREYNDELLRRLAYDHVRYLRMFTQDAFNRSLERSEKLYSEMAADPILSKLAADDITVLLDKESIKNEIKLLQQEIDVLYQNEPDNEGIKNLINKRTALSKFLSVLQDKANLTKKGVFDRRKINKLKSVFQNYLDVLAKNSNGFVDKQRIEDVLKKIVDYGELKGRAVDYDKAIRVLADPGMIDRLFQRQYAYNKEIFINNKNILEKRIKNYLNKEEANTLLNSLADKGIYPAVLSAEQFLQTGNIDLFEKSPFFTEEGQVTAETDRESFNFIKEVISQYRESMEITVDETEQTETSEDSEDTGPIDFADQDVQTSVDILNDITQNVEAPAVNVFGPQTQANPVGVSLVNQLFRKRLKEAAEGGPAAPASIDSANFKKEITPQVEGYKALKKYWYSQTNLKSKYKSQEELMQAYNNDEGFLDFLFTQKTNPQVREILDAGNLTFDDFYKIAGIKNPDIQNIKSEADIVYSSKPSGNYIVRKLAGEDDGQSKPVYQVRTKLDQTLPQNILDQYGITMNAISPTLEEAETMANMLDSKIETSDILVWNPDGKGDVLKGLDLSYGITVTKAATGEEFILTSSPRSLNRYKKLSIIPIEKRNLKRNEGRKEATITMEPQDFAKEYKVTTSVDFKEVAPNVNRLPQQEAIRAYPRKQDNEDRMVAQRRVDVILTQLPENQRKFLELVVTRNRESGKKQGEYGYNMKNGLPTNPYIDVVKEKYTIGIRINPEAIVPDSKDEVKVVDNLKKILSEFGIRYTTDNDGIFAYLPNNNVVIKDGKGNPINPIQITKEVAKNTFIPTKGIIDINKIRTSFAAQANLVDFIDRNMGEDQGQLIINTETLNDYGFVINVPQGFPNYDSAKSLRDLDYYKVDGNIFVFDNRVITRLDEKGKPEIVRANVVLTDMENPKQRVEAINKLKQDLNAQGLLEKAENDSNAYVAVIKSPSGYFTLAELQATPHTPASLEKIFKKLILRAVETTQNNLEEPKKKSQSFLKDTSYNLKFNEEIRNELFISTQPGYNIDLKVDPRGRIEAKILDKTKKGKEQVVAIETPKGMITRPGVLNLDDVAAIAKSEDYNKVLEIFTGVLDPETNKRVGGLNNTPEAKSLSVKINRESMRESFPVDISVGPEEGKINIIDKTTTTLQNVVRNGIRIHLLNDSSFYQAKMGEEGVVEKKDSTREEISNAAQGSSFGVNRDAIDAPVVDDDGFIDVDPESEPRKGPGTQGTFTPTENFTDAEGNPIPKGPEMTTASTRKQVDPAALSNIMDNALEERTRLENAITDRKRELQALYKEGKFKSLRKAFDSDAKLKELKEAYKTLVTANKVLLNPELTNQDIIDIDEFTKWSETALPSFIDIQDINVLGNNLKAGGVRVGAFVLDLHGLASGLNVKGTIYTGASNPYKYHEAFHGVFRTLLTDEEITKYLGIARKEVRAKLRAEGKSFKEELERFKNSADTYKDMSQQRLIQEYYEEYLADEFDKFKTGPKNTNTSSEVKSLFTKILEWIKGVLGAFSRNELTTLFENIDAGKYRTATAVVNRFTNLSEKGITIEANALVPYDKIEVRDKVGFKYLDVDNAANLVASISAAFLERSTNKEYTKKFKSKEELLDATIKDFQDLYDLDSESYLDKSFEQIEILEQYDTALREFQEDIIKGVNTYMELADMSIDERYFRDEQDEDEQGLRGQDDWDKDQSQVGGWGSLSQDMRLYIMTTSFTQEDIFGNSQLLTGEKLIVPVDFGQVYNGFMKALKNTTEDIDILKKMYVYGQTNPQFGAVVNRMFNDIGITQDNIDSGDLLANIKNPSFYNKVIKAFKNFKVDYIFVHRDSNGNVESYSASKRDDAGSQLDIWKQKYDYLYSNFLSVDDGKAQSAATALGKLEGLLKGKVTKAGYLSNLELNKEGDNYFTEISKDIDNTLGIKISPTYIKFSVLKSMPKVALTDLADERILLDAFRSIKPIDPEKITYLIGSVKAGKGKKSKYIFKRDQDEEFKGELSMTGFLTELSANNAPFDESVGASVIKNPNGDLVYTHQKPTLHLRELNKLNNIKRLEDLKNEDYGYLANNLLLNSPAFRRMADLGMIGVTRISGAKDGNLKITEDEIDDSRSIGKTYGDFTPKEFMLTLLNNYTYNYNSTTSNIDSVITLDDGSEIALAPVLIRVIEASNTGDLASLPIIKAVEKKRGKIELTDEVIEAFKNQIKAEFERIKRETNEKTRTKRKVVDYIDGKRNAFKFTKTASLLNPVERTAMLQKTLSIKNSDSTIDRIKEGTQKILVYEQDDVAKYIKFSQKGDRSTFIVNSYENDKLSYQGFIESLGAVKVDATNRAEMIELLGDAIIAGKRTKSHPHEFTIGTETYAAESKSLKFWLLGKGKNVSKIVYKVITPEEAAEVIDRTDVEVDRFGRILVDKSTLKDGDVVYDKEGTKFIYRGLRPKGKAGAGSPRLERTDDSGEIAIPGVNIKLYVQPELSKEAQNEVEGKVYGELGISNYEQEILDNIETARKAGAIPELSFEDAIGSSMKDFDAFLRRNLEDLYLNYYDLLTSVATKQLTGLSNIFSYGIQSEAGSSESVAVARANRLYNLKGDGTNSENLDYNLRQVFFNNYLNTSAINRILSGDPAMTLQGLVNEAKRAKKRNAAFIDIRTSVSAPELGIMHPTDKITMFAFEEPQQDPTYSMDYLRNSEKLNESDKNKKVDNADAQVYATTKAFRHIDFGIGNLSPELANLYDFVEGKKNDKGGVINISNNRILSKDDGYYAKNSKMLNSKKLVYGDRRAFVKMSVFPLTKEFTSTKESGYTEPKPTRVRLHNLRVKMEASEQGNNTIAMAGPLTALKELKENVSPLSVLDNDNAFIEDDAMILSAENMGLQTVTPSNKVIIKDSTQVKTLVTSEQDDNTKVMLNGKEKNLGDVRRAYNKAISDRVTLGYTSRRNSIFNFDLEYANKLLQKSRRTGVIDKDLAVYLQYASDALKASNSTSNILELFSTDENGQQKYNLNSPQTILKFEQLFLSFFSKGVLNEKVSGISAVLASDFGVRVYRRVFSVDENGMPDRQEVIRDDIWNRMDPGSRPSIALSIDEGGPAGKDTNLNGLAGLVEEAGEEGVVIIDRLRQNLKVYDENGVYQLEKYTEALMPAHFESVASLIKDTDRDIPDVIGKMFGVRIPSQDNHSTVNMKLVDFMPTYYGSTAILARELIEISGADFDIDKLYIQIKSFFVDDNDEFIEYGKARGANEAYNHYVRATNAGIKDKKPGLVEGVLRYKSSGALIKLTDAEINDAADSGMSESSIKALSALGLPVTKDQYETYKKENGHEPYSEAMSNDALDYKFTLMGNTAVTDAAPGEVPISYQPAVTQPLEDLLEELKDKSPYFKNLSEELEKNIDGDSPLGQAIQFTSNKAGAKSIGAVVLPNLYLNLLQEYKVELGKVKDIGQLDSVYLAFNSKVYKTFAKEKDSDDRYRKQYVLSALITAMTDNAKLVLSHKLGLNKDALGVVANMTALSVPIKTSILLINHPTIRELYFNAINKKSPMDPGIEKLTAARISKLNEAFEDLERETVTDEKLLTAINDYNIEDANKTVGQLKEEGVLTFETASVELSVLEQFMTALKIRDYNKNMSSIMNLVNGLGSNVSEMADKARQINNLGINLSKEDYVNYTDDRLAKKLPIIDVRPLFKNTWQGRYLDIFTEVGNKLLPNILLSSTPEFMKLYNTVVDNMDNLGTEGVENVRTDLVAYLTIKAYQKKLLETNSQSAASLSNDLLYPQLEGEKITDVVKRLRGIDPSNFFLQNFVILTNATSVGNRQGIYKAEANTFRSLNDKQKVKLQTSFSKLYGDLTTRPDAIKILHYMMIKDGFKYAYASLSDAITPFIYDLFLQQIGNVEKAMFNSPESFFIETFGMNYSDLTDEFIKNYLVSSRNRTKLHLRKFIPVLPFTETDFVVSKSKSFTKKEVTNSPSTLFIFSDNEAQQGTDGNRGLRDFSNTISLVYKRNLGTNPEDYYQDVNEFSTMFDQQLENILNKKNTGYKNTKLPLYLIPQYDLKPLKQNSPDVYNYIKDKVSEVFEGYDIDKGKVPVKKKSKKANSYKPNKSKGVWIEGQPGNTKLIVNTYLGKPITKDDSTDDKISVTVRKPRLALGRGMQKSQSDKLKKMGFVPKVVSARGLQYLEVELPYVLKVEGGSALKKEYKYYALSKVQSGSDVQESGLLVGNYAEYVETKILGSDGVSPIAFIGGERPTTTAVQQFVKNTNMDPIDDGGAIDQADLSNIDMSNDPMAKKAEGIKDGTAQADVLDGVLLDINPVSDVNATDGPGVNIDDLVDIDPSRGNAIQLELNLDEAAPQGLSEEVINFWNENIQNNKNNLAKLQKEKLGTLALLEEARKKFTGNDEQFMENIKCFL